MEDAPLSFVLAFLLPFHVGGGAALGVALHNTFKGGFSCSGVFQNGFLFLWGAMFGGIPLLFGLAMETPWFFAIELLTFVGAIVVVALGYDWLKDLYTNPGMFMGTFGLVFSLVGFGLAALMIGGGEPSGGFIGLVFGGIGGVLLLAGVLMMLRS
jgi:hypothetical protein